MLALQVVHEGLDIADRGAETGAVPPRTRRLTVATGIPCHKGHVGQVQLINEMGHATTMLVPAMEERDRATARTRHGGPVAVTEHHAIVRLKRQKLWRACGGHRWRRQMVLIKHCVHALP